MRAGAAVSVIAFLVCSTAPVTAEALRLVGATTFTSEVMVPYQAEIEAASGQRIVLLPSRSNFGIYGLFEGHHIAMISTSLDSLIGDMKKARPDLAYDRLQVFNISKTRVAFSVHPSNPVRSADIAAIGQVLTGEITNWRQLGGNDLPIRVVAVREGGGVQASIEAKLGIKMAVQDPIRVQISYQVNKVVEQEPAALGLAQIENLRQRSAVELVTDRTVEQQLDMVTLGQPSPAALAVIEAVRKVVASKDGPAGAPAANPDRL